MSDALNTLSTALDKLYRDFVLRDLLGFVFPGAIIIVSIWCLVARPDMCLQQCIAKLLEINPSVVQVFVFLGISYTTAWVLQVVHYAFVDCAFLICKRKELRAPLCPLIWPLRVYVRSMDVSPERSIEALRSSPSLITRGALNPDVAIARLGKAGIPETVRYSLPYDERARVLAIMTANLAFASVFLVIVLVKKLGWWYAFGIIVSLFLYVEYWRLWYTVNLRRAIYVQGTQGSLTQDTDHLPGSSSE
jgi:hypothetical protein